MKRTVIRRTLLSALPLILAGILVTAGSSSAAACSFTGPSGGNWHTAGNWSCAKVPDAGDSVFLDSADNVSVSAAASAGSLSVSGGTVTLRLSRSS